MAILKKDYEECVILAPSQIANCFGPLDRIGVLGKRPPFSPEERVGGPGNWIRVTRLKGEAGIISLNIDVRDCDEQGYWNPRKRFDQLHAEIKVSPKRDLATILAKTTLRYISKITGENICDGLDIHIVIHTPNGRTGLGLGGSASSSAVVLAIDALYGSPIRNLDSGDQQLLRLMGKGEKIVANAVFYDNVAPLAIQSDAVYLPPTKEGIRKPKFERIKCPQNTHIVTITPEFELSTKVMNEVLEGGLIEVREAEAAAARYMDIRHALDTSDLKLLIASSGNSLAEPIRAKLINGVNEMYALTEKLNATYDGDDPHFACGVSGSGPTMYILTNSYANADRAGFELHKALKEQGISSWWFCHQPNPNGAEIYYLN